LGRTVGVAPEATWFACANLQRNLANPALYLDCMQFMLAPFPPGGDPLADGDPRRAAHVLNNSWGCPWEHEGCDPPSLLPAVQALRAAGIFVVASAGNEGPACGTVAAPLAIYDEAVSVGAVDQANDLAIFSSAGPVLVDGSSPIKPDIVAPGVRILSAYPGNTYSIADGTSMAGPHVAGVVALMWSANPDLIGDIERTEQILLETATPFSGALSGLDMLPTENDLEDERASDFAARIDQWLFALANACLYTTNIQQRPNNVVGYGIVDAYRAVQRALAER
jgi:subtilisin family serine protease